jgi:hypothetical protein
MVHVLSVSPVEKTELLLAVGGIVGGVEIEQDLATLADLSGTETDELLAPSVTQMYQIAGAGRVFPAAEGRLRAECIAQFLVGNDLQEWIMAQTIGVVGVFIAGDNLIEALPPKGSRVMPESVLLSPITENSGPIMAQMMTLIKSAQREQTGVAGDLATGEIGTDSLMTIEGKAQLW